MLFPNMAPGAHESHLVSILEFQLVGILHRHNIHPEARLLVQLLRELFNVLLTRIQMEEICIHQIGFVSSKNVLQVEYIKNKQTSKKKKF